MLLHVLQICQFLSYDSSFHFRDVFRFGRICLAFSIDNSCLFNKSHDSVRNNFCYRSCKIVEFYRTIWLRVVVSLSVSMYIDSVFSR